MFCAHFYYSSNAAGAVTLKKIVSCHGLERKTKFWKNALQVIKYFLYSEGEKPLLTHWPELDPAKLQRNLETCKQKTRNTWRIAHTGN